MNNRHYNQRASAMIKSLCEWDTMDAQDRQSWLDQCVELIYEGLDNPRLRLSAIRCYLKIVEACLYKGAVQPVIVLLSLIRECVPSVQFLSQLDSDEQKFWLIAHAMSLAYNAGLEDGMKLCEQSPLPIQENPNEFHPN